LRVLPDELQFLQALGEFLPEKYRDTLA